MALAIAWSTYTRDGLEVSSERGRLGRSGAGRLVPAPDTPIRPGLARTLREAPAQGKEPWALRPLPTGSQPACVRDLPRNPVPSSLGPFS